MFGQGVAAVIVNGELVTAPEPLPSKQALITTGRSAAAMVE
jgi:hypothetical protein